ncbi:MAG: isoprenylcysteine carboxylmethyltransferase family protein, partial [Bdellovibrionota bacterium]
MPPQLAENRTSSPLYHWYRGFIQGKTRIVIAWILALTLALSAREGPHLPGILLCLMGAAVRYWASGYLRKDSRPAIGGPYAFVRNPLYLGTLLMAIGTAWSAGQRLLACLILVVFGAIYHFIIFDEEVKLERLFGEPYRLYKSQVPRFFPTFLKPSRTVIEYINP